MQRRRGNEKVLLGAAAPSLDGRDVPLLFKGQAVDLANNDHGDKQKDDEDGANLDAESHVAYLEVTVQDGQERELSEEDTRGPELCHCLSELRTGQSISAYG